MLYQHRASPFRPRSISGRTVPVGLLPAGTFLRTPTGLAVIDAWLNRTCGAARVTVDAGTGARRYADTTMAGGHLAIVRDLRTGTRRVLADHWLRQCPVVEGPVVRRAPRGRVRRRLRRQGW